MSETVLVTGATGNTGTPLVKMLRSADVAVRIMVRDDEAASRFPGTQVAVADFDDSDAVNRALQGVDRTYLVTPSTERAEDQQLRFVELAAEAGVRHVVKLSQLAADESSPVRFLRYHAVVERRIRELGVEFTFLRPNLFYQGLLGMAESVRSQGKFFAPIGDARISAVDVRDIAAVAAHVLTEPGHAGQTYTITGPAAVTHAEIAAEIAAAVGRDVSFIDAPPEVFAEALNGVLPQWQIDGLIEDYAHYSRGEAEQVFASVSEVTGRAPRDLSAFARDYADAFTAPSD